MTGHKSQIDFILVNRKWRNSVKNVEPYSSFSSVGSDHRIVTAKVKLSLRSNKKGENIKNRQGVAANLLN